jgi:methionine-rich copper-binding protein CopC
MSRKTIRRAVVSLAALAVATSAWAHARLIKASPAAGGTVASPSEIRLKFTEALEPRFSSISLADASGAVEPLDAANVDPADHSTLIARVAKVLPAGIHTVTWRAVSVDTHRTQGSFKFTVAP